MGSLQLSSSTKLLDFTPFFRDTPTGSEPEIISKEPKLINLSSRKLGTDEIFILEKGLKFTPTPKAQNIPEMEADISHFCRKLRLAEFFLDESVNDDSLVRNKSTFTPGKGRNKELDQFIEHLAKFPLNEINNKRFKRSNFTRKQWETVGNLTNDPSIIIKEADKGNAVVIMDTDYYRNLSLDILNDESYYTENKTYKIKGVMKNLDKIVNNVGNGLTDKEKDYLVNFKFKESNFYGLPKIHKSKIINDACSKSQTSYVENLRPNDLKLRPIVAGPACETHRLSNLIDILLKPFLTKVRSYIRDTMDFLNNLPERTPPGSILVSFDVTNLYSNIPHDLGINAIKYWLNKYPELIPDRISKEFILTGLKFILENNNFHFDDNHYRQILGTAMGTKVAPTYGTLTLAFLEEEMYNKIEQFKGLEEIL